jgi:TPR repeat
MTNKKSKGKTGKLLLPNAYNVAVQSENNPVIDLEKNALESILAKGKNNLDLPNAKENKESKPLAQDGAVKKALAEISFIEANETLEKGDIQSAIAKYKEAISYSENNADYYLKLVDAFNKDSKYKSELDVLLKDVTRKFPDNGEVKAKLAQLNPLPKQEAKKTSKPNDNKKGTETSSKLLEHSKEQKHTEKITKSLKSNAKSNANVDSNIDNSRMRKLKNNVYVFTEGTKKQNTYVQVITVAFLILLPIAILFGLNRSYKETIIETIPVAPESQSNLLVNQLYFCWTSNTDKTDYLLQIEQEGKPVLERYTREKFYSLSQEDAKSIKKNVYCTWRAIPISPKREPLKYKSSDGQFMVVK